MGKQLAGGRFLGRTVRKRVVGELTLADVLYPGDAHLARHSHERAYFCLIRRGSYSEAYGRRTRICRPMTLAFHPPGEPHAETFAGRAVMSFNVEIGTEWLCRMSESTGPLDQPAEFHGGEIATLGSRLFDEFAREDADSALAIESLTCEILAGCASLGFRPADVKQPGWLARARDLLDARFQEPLTLRSVAREAGVHPVYCAFKLADRELPLAEIALDAGFADQSHLTRTFKRYTGRTPAQYRTFLRFKTA